MGRKRKDEKAWANFPSFDQLKSNFEPSIERDIDRLTWEGIDAICGVIVESKSKARSKAAVRVAIDFGKADEVTRRIKEFFENRNFYIKIEPQDDKPNGYYNVRVDLENDLEHNKMVENELAG